ncbi:MAG TPA: phosphoglycerate dehydrogenase [Planctomycetota bacterium]|nr:phosphoglycerate dehydrogenase [Planctomycetota bacterium]
MPAAPFRVLVADSIEAEGIAALKAAGLAVDARKGLDEAELVAAVAEADAVVVRSKTVVTAKAIEAGRRLRLVTRAGIGVDTVDLAAASRRGVVVTNVPDATTTTTAELAIALLLALARRIPAADKNVHSGKWDRAKFLGTEVAGKTLGVLGLGRIGRIVADRALGLRMRVVAFDPFLPRDAPPMHGVALLELDELLASADFLTIHAPLTDQTRGLLGAAQLVRAKRGLRIVNAARGGILEEAALVAALKSGQVAGAALDVFDEEPLPADSPLRAFDQVILTPHLGASTEEAQRRVALDAAAQVIAFARTGAAPSAVNFPSIPEDLREEVGPYLDLAERLGLLAARLASARVRRLSLLFHGELLTNDRVCAALRSAALAGVLRPSLEGDVTPVNAPILARERGIEVLEAREPRDRDFVHRLVLEATVEGGATLRLDGTCLGRRSRLVALDGVSLDASLEGDLLVTRHLDRPGMVGRIGTLLGERGVNIDRVDLGSLPPASGLPRPADGHALGIFGVKDELSAEVVAAVRALDGVRSACSARFPRGG